MAVLLAQNHEVTAVDVIPEKVELLQKGRSPIRDKEIKEYLAGGRLHLQATLDGEVAYRDAELVIVSTPTNYDPGIHFFDTGSVETVVEKENGKEREVEVKLYPSYVFVKMCMTDETWHIVRNISGVTGFVGPGSRPVPLLDEEVANMGIESRVVELGYAIGDSVRVISGALSGFVGVVKEISEDKKKIMVLASMFGRETPVELDADSVQKLEI